jgi:hypothetical protein
LCGKSGETSREIASQQREVCSSLQCSTGFGFKRKEIKTVSVRRQTNANQPPFLRVSRDYCEPVLVMEKKESAKKHKEVCASERIIVICQNGRSKKAEKSSAKDS